MGWKTVGFATVPPSGLPPQSRATGPSDTILWEPSPWLRQVAADLPATGAGLDLACGSGRNTVYLAWTRSQSRKDSPDAAASSGTSSAAGSRAGPRASSTVYGVDILPDALDQARQLREDARRAAARRAAAAEGAKLEARFHQADMSSHEALRRWLPAGKWSVVVVLRYLDREILPAIADSLEPGGHLVYQTFLEEQRIRKGSPRNDRHLLRPGELRKAFGSLEPLRYEEGEDDEGNVLASLWARRP